MKIADQINNIISTLTDSLDDAAKFDGGKVGAPGTRVRAAAQKAKKLCDELRKGVTEARKVE